MDPVDNLETIWLESGEPLLQYFQFSHLPAGLQEVSREFAKVAVWLVNRQPRAPERTVALRKLLEAKDCAVRQELSATPPAKA